MRYLPTVDLWNNATNNAVRTGQLKLQPGQWVKCGNNRASRWCGKGRSGSMVAAHPKGERGVSNSDFQTLLTYARSIK